MKRNFTIRTMLIAALLLLGGVNVWGEEIFGTINDDYLTATSTKIALYDGGEINYSFSQVTADEAVFHGFVVAADSREGDELIRLRQDFYDNVTKSNTGCTANYPSGWVENFHFFNNASVDMKITYSAGVFSMSSTINGSDNGTYNYGYTKEISGHPAGIIVYLGNDHSQITLTNQEYLSGTVAVSLDHTASSSRDANNSITTTVDATAEHYNNNKAAAWGGWAYAQFSFNIPSDESIESATLIWSTKIGGNNATNRNNDIYYVKADKTIDYSISSTTNLNLTADATYITTVSLLGTKDHKDVTTDVTEAVRTIATSQNYIIFEWTNNAAGADLYGKASNYAPVLIIKTTGETLYRVTFTETNGVESIVTMDDNDVTNGTSLGNGSYSFVAKADGYYDYEGSFEVSGEDKEVQFTMTEKPTFTYTVNAVDENGELLQSSIASTTHYEGETGNVTWSKYIKVGDSWYVTDETPFVTTATSSGEKNVVYKPSNIFYFVECEKMNGVRTDRDATEEGGSNNVYIRMSKYSVNYYTDFFAEGGVFDIDVPYYNSNEGAEEYKIQTYDGSTYTDTGLTLKCASKGSGSMTQKGIVVPAGSAIAITYSGTGNALARMDYLTLTRSTVSQTIINAEWATLYTPMALNFAGTGLKAYTATVANDVVTLASVNDVPANTGVVLNGTPGDYEIPGIASSTTDKGDLQGSLTEDLTYDENAANDYYMLALNGKKVQFTKLISGSIAAGKAYLVLPKDPTTGARTLTVAFSEGGTTGISEIENSKSKIENYFNLNGQRVSKPTKGLYIVNGKKVVLK